MYNKARDKAETLAGKVQKASGRATGDCALRLEGKLRKHAAQACECVNDCMATLKRKTADDPVSALLIAGGVGFLLAKVLGPRRR
ncbi:CsbD family protein [Martelella alba]|uniref:CsbD family protein n=1 Tax=Martelella alba TaxID=2590451 RepID=A0ABY2SQA1_9HYPH|nr:CsbD family protein [Martelella alba]TKI08272.1 CsbD family protein [Martelella alba]